MFKPGHNVEPVEVLTQPGQRRRRSVEEKLAIVSEIFEPGTTVSGIACRHQVNANQFLGWRKLYQDGSLSGLLPFSRTGSLARDVLLELNRAKEVQC